MKSRITIGMTAYNSSEFIGESIRSLLSQTVSNIKLFISDDASTDSTEKICRLWQERDSRIVYLRQEKNLGPRANFEFVLSQCDTDYFVWASHDDIWSRNFVEECSCELDRDSEAGFVITRWRVESRKIPFVRRINLPNMGFISDPDPISRMLAFTALPFSSFKDNLTYGVWRASVLRRIVEDTKSTGYFSIGGVMNEYALLIAKGQYLPNAYLRKRYRYFPPGIIFEDYILSLRNLILQNQPKILYSNYTNQDHLYDLIKVLKLANLDQNTINMAVDLNRIHLRMERMS